MKIDTIQFHGEHKGRRFRVEVSIENKDQWVPYGASEEVMHAIKDLCAGVVDLLRERGVLES